MTTLREIKRSVKTLTLKEVAKLEAWLHSLIDIKESKLRKVHVTGGYEVLETPHTPHQTYRLELVRCG